MKLSNTLLSVVALGIVSRHKHVRAALPPNVLEKMDTTVDPCDDFYQYSCGAWLKNATFGPTDTILSASFIPVERQAETVIQQIVQENYPFITEFWQACMNTAQIEKLGSAPLDPSLKRIVGVSDLVNVVKLAGQFRTNGFALFTDIATGPDLKNATMNALYVGAATSLGLKNSGYYLDNDTFSQLEGPYRTYITGIMKLAGFAPGGKYQQKCHNHVVDLNTTADKIIALEKKIAAILPDQSSVEDPLATYHPITIAEATVKYPLTFGAYSQGFGLLQRSTLKPTSKVIFNDFDYAKKAEELAKKTDVLDLKLYLAFLYINNNVRFLDDAYYNIYFELFARILNGQQVRAPRKTICSDREVEFLPDVIGNYYYKKMFDQTRQENADLMIKLIEQTMHDHIAKLTWLDDTTRAAAEAKLAKVANHIGHSTEPINYPFKLANDAYVENVATITLYNFDIMLKQAGQPVDRLAWGISAATVNAYYDPSLNEMVFPAAILQYPFFNGTSHPAQNFGGIGVVMGHELTHGFDSDGRRFDGYGNVVNWWDNSTLAEFNKRAQCMENEYSQFVINGLDGKPLGNVNGNQTITENIADNGGFSLSWDAYHSYMKTATNVNTQGVLPGEDEKLLFISFAQVWCSKYRDEMMVQNLQTDVHSPAQARVMGVMMNSDHFAPTFQCKAGSKMNPTTKCQLW